MKAPFPYSGSKSRHAAAVWARLGDPDVYAEPFAGSLAALLARPHEPRREIVCDKDANIVNFWRALRAAPDQVAAWADAPTYHQECTARHAWIQETNEQRRTAVSADPDYYDVRAAGYWVHGVSNWVGTAYGAPVTAGHNKRPHVCTVTGQGVQVQTGRDIPAWFSALAERLRKVVVLDRDWTSAVTPSVLLQGDQWHYDRKPSVAVFLDPPYRTNARRRNDIYKDYEQAPEVAAAAYEWAVEHGARYRVAYAMNVDDFPVPDGWTYQDWPPGSGRKGDRVLFSPACAGGRQLGLFQ